MKRGQDWGKGAQSVTSKFKFLNPIVGVGEPDFTIEIVGLKHSRIVIEDEDDPDFLFCKPFKGTVHLLLLQ